MNGSQMVLVVGAIVIFAFLALSINNSLSNTAGQSANAEYISMATNLGQSIINKVSTKAFDQKTINFPAYSSSVLTPVDSLGPDPSETSASFNDVDDYNNFDTTINTARTGVFNLHVDVSYANENNLTQISNVPTRTKRIEVKITNPFFKSDGEKRDTVKMYYYKSY